MLQLTPISSTEEVRSLLQKVSDNWARQGRYVFASGRYDDSFAASASDFYVGYGVNIKLRGDWVGFTAVGRSAASDRLSPVLEFSVASPESGVGKTAGILARDARGSVYLLHDGRVTTDGRGRPQNDNVIEVDGRNYYFIGRLQGSRLFEDIIDFHLSRDNQDLGRAKVGRATDGYDPGRTAVGSRSGALVGAWHHPITAALRDAVPSGFDVADPGAVRPDLFVTDGIQRVLFEVKPFAFSQDLMLAIGQLAVYGAVTRASKRILVCPPLRTDGLSLHIARLLEELGIGMVSVRKNGVSFDFDGLTEVFA
jgi:hypothetical protein